ncbi:cupin domain-containing protein [Kaistia granuli]|uniref:cupin domain-containing protein n=1 Tax=Kaistia granuli TaxID=363259 RepID=UPI00037C110A|nr:cupin domain-containing protein [Kaistia granuli]
MPAFDKPVASLPGQERIVRNAHGGRVFIHATAAETAGVLGMWETFSAPGTGPHWHTHTRETEAFRVISGRYRFWCGDTVIEGGPGTTITLPPHVPHRWLNISEETGRMLAIVTPGGFEQLFIELERTGASSDAEVLALERALGIVDSGLQASPP